MVRSYLRRISVLYGSNEDGAALIVGLLIMVILTILGGGALLLTTTEINIASNYEGSIQAVYAAEAGAEKVYDAFYQGDTNGDEVVNGSDTANADNDLDGDGTIDFIQVFTNHVNIGSGINRITVNTGNTQALIWVDASNAPALVTIWSKGSPSGTNSQREVALTVTTSAENIINGSLNNAI